MERAHLWPSQSTLSARHCTRLQLLSRAPLESRRAPTVVSWSPTVIRSEQAQSRPRRLPQLSLNIRSPFACGACWAGVVCLLTVAATTGSTWNYRFYSVLRKYGRSTGTGTVLVVLVARRCQADDRPAHPAGCVRGDDRVPGQGEPITDYCIWVLR